MPMTTSDHRPAVVAGFLGWTLDAFDFFLVVMTLTAIGATFGKSDKDIAFTLLLTLGFRPVGALIFGLIADRYGRRVPLMLDLVFFSIIEVLSGLAPNYVTFCILRALFGIGMGAEWGVGASLVMEKVPVARRGIFSGLLQQGYATGYLLAALCYFFVFPRWGWRPLFFIGGLPALLALYVRSQVSESETWQRSRAGSWGDLGQMLMNNWKTFVYIFVLMALMNGVSHGTQDLYPTLLKRDWGFETPTIVGLTALSMVGALTGGVVCGHYSDRIGRRRMIVAALVGALVLIPLWAFAPNVILLAVGGFLMQVMVQGAWGVIPAHITELSPDAVRGVLPGFGYQCGAAIAGLMPWLGAKIAAHTGYAWAMAATAGTVFVLCAIVAWVGPERRGIVYGTERTDRSDA
jgi:SHS family lactate transporter-like MFS transporter